MYRQWLGYGSLLILWVGIVSGCAGVPPCETLTGVETPAPQMMQSATLSNSALQQKVKAQEKRITELSMQLNLLKRIDHDQLRQR